MLLKQIGIILYLTFVTINSAEIDKSVCLLARDEGDQKCNLPSSQQFYYHSATKRCQPFLYKGCNGNGNRFESASKCNEICSSSVEEKSHELTKPKNSILSVPKCKGGVRAAVNLENKILTCAECPKNHTCVDNLCCPSKEFTCNLQYNSGKYAAAVSHISRYFYVKNMNDCLVFTFYGVLGNANNFDTYNECLQFCGEKKN